VLQHGENPSSNAIECKKQERKCKCRAADLMVLAMRSSKMRGKTVVEALINYFSVVKAFFLVECVGAFTFR
jgi:hypothetical protein